MSLLVIVAACSRESAPPAAKQQPPAVTAKPPTKQLAEPPRPKELRQVTIKALGMYCEESCPLKVRYALADITAVYELGFDISNESIFVSYDASLGTPKEVTKPMIAAIKQTGFDPWLAKEEWPADAKVQVVLR
ncbi:MAG TPA: heavy metal-associated domain-containing protein [Kofleriaceae bacterium]